MRTIFLLLSILISFLSCNRNEKKLYGKWYGIEKYYPFMIFKKDTLAIQFYGENLEKVIWNADDKIIEFDYPIYYSDTLWTKMSVKYKKIKYKYEIRNDTLKCDYKGNLFNLIKANNYTEYLSKKHQVKFQLPENNKLKRFRGFDEYGLNIFVGKWNDEIVYRTEYSDNLDNLKKDFEKLQKRFLFVNPIRLHYRVFADKNIPQSILKNVYLKLRKTEVKKIYRIYKRKKNHGYRYEYIK